MEGPDLVEIVLVAEDGGISEGELREEEHKEPTVRASL